MNNIYMTLFVIVLALTGLTGNAATRQQMRFHCEKDTAEINTLLQRGLKSGKTDPNALVSFYAHELLDRPYVAHTLDQTGNDEFLVIDVDEFDCTTFVETLYALARTTMSGHFSWRDYAANLENLRYRRGVLDGYASRLHYISEWAVDNISRGNIVEVSGDLPASKAEVKTINFMTTHRDLYPQLSDSATCAKLRNFEIGYRNHKFEYVRKNMVGVKDVKNALLEGDIVGLVTKIEGLDVSHMGIIVKDEKGDNYLLDASASAGKVQVEPLALPKYLEKVKTCTGLRVFRIVKQ